MSRQAEEAYAKWHDAHVEECRRVLVVGVRVYRAGWDRIEEGEVTKIDRVRYDTWSNQEIEDPNGAHIRYHARFENGTRWESQTFQWRWFCKIEDAKRDSSKKLRERAKDSRRDADRWDALANTFDTAPLAKEA